MAVRHPHDGLLLSYLDGQLTPVQSQELSEHLEICRLCQRRLSRLEMERAQVSQALTHTRPSPLDRPSAHRALANLRAVIGERKDMSMKLSKKMQRVLAGAVALIVIGVLLSLAPVRALASDFLSLFRVQEFVVVDVDDQRMEEIAAAINNNMHFGEEEVLQDPGQPVEVSSLDEAAAQAGFVPRRPQGHGDPTRIEVTGLARMRYTPDVETLRQVFVAMELDPALLPDNIDGQPFVITIPASITQTYGELDDPEGFIIGQIPSPSVEVPEGVDMQALGNAMLQLLGMTPAEAERLSQTIDWTTTLVVPIPASMSVIQEVEVDGTTGLYILPGCEPDPSDPDESYCGGGMLLWEKNGFIMVVIGNHSTAELFSLTSIVESLN
jgi:anti-sigma factor RsiW